MSRISTHVLDTSRGRPAYGVQVQLDLLAEGGWTPVGSGATNADGRCELIGDGSSVESGIYRLTFATKAYFRDDGVRTFFPEVQIQFQAKAGQRFHVPLLISPFGYSTYRGS